MTAPGTQIDLADKPPVRSAPTDTGVWYVAGLTEKGTIDPTIRPDGSDLTRIRSNAADPAWSPDGRRIAYDKITFRGHWGNALAYDHGIEVVQADGSHPVWLTPGRWGRGQSPSYPTWSPNGDRLAYLQTPRRGPHSGYRGEIWTISADGSDKKRLYRSAWGLGSYATPIWSPDRTS